MWVVIDLESDDLKASRIWVIVCKEIQTGKVTIFREPDLNKQEFIDYAKQVDGWIGLNLLDFDAPTINRLVAANLVDYRRCIDLLVVARLLDYGIEGGNSLDAWGKRLGIHKGHFDKAKFANFLDHWDEGLEYCLQDVEVTEKLYQRLKPYIESKLWKDALRLEHDIAILCREMQDNGFHFDIEGARSLHREVTEKIAALTEELQVAFPPKSKLIREITPKATKHGTISRTDFRWLSSGDLSSYSVGAPFSRIEFVPFNPGSPKQRVEILNAAGWSPTEKTKGHLECERDLRTLHFQRLPWKEKERERQRLEERLEHYKVYGWTCSEENLATLPADAPEPARKLAQWLLLDSRRSTLEEWFNAYNETTGRIHGKFNHIGAWTQRMSHAAPNMANIPSNVHPKDKDKPTPIEQLGLWINPIMRSFWTVPKNKLLVGVDADGIQLRVLAHYMQDQRFIDAILKGDKAAGTDMHSMNRRALGEHICKSRDDAKTFIYAWLLGAGIGKVAQILGCSSQEAVQANENFLNYYPGLQRLKRETIPADAATGYFQGFDGRLVKCDSEHLMLAGYLQNGESIVMKRAAIKWTTRLRKERIPFLLVDYVHDEWQTEVEGDLDLALYVANIQADSIKEVGEELNLNCPLAGSILSDHGAFEINLGGDPKPHRVAVGHNWYQTH